MQDICIQAEAYGTRTSSTIKGVLDNWYLTNIQNAEYSSYIDTNAGFCNGRTPLSGTGTGTTYTEYGARYRLYNSGSPTFGCSDKGNDLFTVSSSNKGNHALTYPIGLITTDEAWYAGGYQSNNISYYLYTNQAYWTMSPSTFLATSAYEFYLDSSGGLYSNTTNSAYGLRPVINLKADTLFEAGGEGTSSNSYVVIQTTYELKKCKLEESVSSGAKRLFQL